MEAARDRATRREGARARRERRRRAEARLRLALARDAAALAGHRGGPPPPASAAGREVREEEASRQGTAEAEQRKALEADVSELRELIKVMGQDLRSYVDGLQRHFDGLAARQERVLRDLLLKRVDEEATVRKAGDEALKQGLQELTEQEARLRLRVGAVRQELRVNVEAEQQGREAGDSDLRAALDKLELLVLAQARQAPTLLPAIATEANTVQASVASAPEGGGAWEPGAGPAAGTPSPGRLPPAWQAAAEEARAERLEAAAEAERAARRGAAGPR